MSWLERIFRSKPTSSRRANIPDGVWSKCPHCMQILYREELTRNQEVCPLCNHHMAISARKRLQHFLDPGTWIEIGSEHLPKDPLKFKDLKKYTDRLHIAKQNSGEDEALLVVSGQLRGIPVIAAAFNFSFMGGSMGSAVGARFIAGVDKAVEEQSPLVCFCASGGARMQEGLFSLMQMARTSSSISLLKQQKLPYISVLTHPTMGGVSASLATLGDILIAEPHALIGFSGPRVIEQTINKKLPPGFQRSEFLLEKGAIDMIQDRTQLRSVISRLLKRLLFFKAIA